MRVVLDTNIFLSALISSRGIPGLIQQAWKQRWFDLVTSRYQLDELKRVSRYPKFKTILQPHRIGDVINHLERSIVLERLSDVQEEIADPDDLFLLAMAVAGEADYLVTGDYRAGLLERGNIQRTRIISPDVFYQEVLR